ncbi:MAG: hypothetical protein J7578_20950, partial [Chitinophagaceae bacterium]|nr:hypothetical protein [Chitinophagaceae bacterium]
VRLSGSWNEDRLKPEQNHHCMVKRVENPNLRFFKAIPSKFLQKQTNFLRFFAGFKFFSSLLLRESACF